MIAERVLNRLAEQDRAAEEAATAVAPTPARVVGRAVLLIPHRSQTGDEAALADDYRKILAIVRARRRPGPGQGCRRTALHTGLSLIPWALGSAVVVALAGAVLTQKLGRATLQLGRGIAVIGLLALWWTIVHRGDSLTSWTLAPSLLLIGFDTGLVFVPIFDFILGGATTEEVGTGAGMLNAVQQFSGAVGVAALGTVFFARVNDGGTPAFDHVGELVIGLATVLFLITFALVWPLPKHAQHAASRSEARARPPSLLDEVDHWSGCRKSTRHRSTLSPEMPLLNGHPSTVAARVAAHWPHLVLDRASADAIIATKAQLRGQGPRNRYRDRTFDLRITMRRLHVSVYS